MQRYVGCKKFAINDWNGISNISKCRTDILQVSARHFYLAIDLLSIISGRADYAEKISAPLVYIRW